MKRGLRLLLCYAHYRGGIRLGGMIPGASLFFCFNAIFLMSSESPEAAFQLGTMYWMNPRKSAPEIEEDLRRIRANHFTIIRKFVWWESIERTEGAFDFAQNDFIYEAAARQGLSIMETYGLYLPHWLKLQLAEKGIVDKDRYYCLDRPEIQAPLKRFLEAVVNRYKEAPALKIWNVWNEPTKPPCCCEHTLGKFVAWLKDRYGSVENLREAWGGEFQVFDTLLPESFEALTVKWVSDAFRFGLRGRVTPMEYDWTHFSAFNLTENIQWLADLTKALDPIHETHANPNCPTGNGMMDGQDVYLQASVLDSISESVHHSHHFYNEKDVEAYPTSLSFSADKIRSWGDGRGKDAWIGELQAGTTYYHRKQYTPSAEDITHALWHSLGRGVKGVLFWEWQAWRSSMMEVGEFSLRRATDGGPTERSEAAAAFGRALEAHTEVFRSVNRPRSEIAIFYSIDNSSFKALQKRGKPFLEEIEHEHTFAAYGCYKALNRANLAVDFVTEEQVAEGILKNYRVLYLPQVELMSARTAIALRKFVERGGFLWADGRCAFLDEHVFLRDLIPGHGLDAIFGAREVDFVASRGRLELSLSVGGRLQGFRFAQSLEPRDGGEVRGTFADGRPAIVSKSCVTGRTELVGTYLSLGLRDCPDPATMDYVADFAISAGVAPMVEIEPKNGFEACRLSGETWDVLIVSNRLGEAAEAILRTLEPYESIVIAGDPDQAVDHDEKLIRRTFSPRETVAFLARKFPR